MDSRISQTLGASPAQLGKLHVFLENRTTQDLPPGRMTLRSAILNNRGLLANEQLLDERVCTCCAPAAVLTDEGVLIAYRDRSSVEIRDISTLLLKNDAPTEKSCLAPMAGK